MLRAITNARVVTASGIVEGGSVIVEEGRITGVLTRGRHAGETLDAGGRYVVAGLVDLHSDAIEMQRAPRPGVGFPPELAFVDIDRLLATCGITTGFHALSFRGDGGRSYEAAAALWDSILALRDTGLIRHELNLRCELPHERSRTEVLKRLETGAARIVSLADHTPGQGQFRDLEWYRRYQRGAHGATEAEVDRVLATAELTNGAAALAHIELVARAATANGAAVASHDDDTAEKVDAIARRGVTISEFPVRLEAARRAKEIGLTVCAGAPNVVRGRSSGGNLSATEAARAGCLDAVCSDYHPPSMLRAAWALARDGVLDLPRALRLVTTRPAQAAGLDDRGEIGEGLLADLVVVEERLGRPLPVRTLVGGREVLTTRRGADERPTT